MLYECSPILFFVYFLGEERTKRRCNGLCSGLHGKTDMFCYVSTVHMLHIPCKGQGASNHWDTVWATVDGPQRNFSSERRQLSVVPQAISNPVRNSRSHSVCTPVNEGWPLWSTIGMRALGRGQAASVALRSLRAKCLDGNCFCGLLGRSLPAKANLLGVDVGCSCCLPITSHL